MEWTSDYLEKYEIALRLEVCILQSNNSTVNRSHISEMAGQKVTEVEGFLFFLKHTLSNL